jgi:thiamine kinase-like enzyme
MITIDEAIARIPEWQGARAESITPLAGGITNLNYRVEIGGDTFVVSIAGAGTEALGISRELAYQCTRAASDLGVGPGVAYVLPADGVLVTRFISGRRLTAADAAHPETLTRIVRSFQRYHTGPAFPGVFSPFETLRAYLRTAQTSEAAHVSGARIPEDIGTLYERIAAIEDAVGRDAELTRPCHNDLWESNLIDDGTMIRIIDWEYAGTGNVYFDLANFAIHNTFADPQDEALLRAYFGDVSRAGFARLQLLKIVAELREAMWAMVAQGLPATRASGFDSRGYAATHFARCRRAVRDRHLSGWFRALKR